MSRRPADNDDYFGLPHPWGKVVVGAAVCGAVYGGLAYFKKDQDVADSFNKFSNNVESDARGFGRDLKAHGRDFRARADDKARDLNFR
ncbi:hypothetical protein ABBQ38_008891 [Trebouxia sp. C0009 RCD-2024]